MRTFPATTTGEITERDKMIPSLTIKENIGKAVPSTMYITGLDGIQLKSLGTYSMVYEDK